ncbi:methyltransferase [Candidatus Woesearchaeota archaeon]|nr:methyltransferase [Candidatus Woesearchaeota archaeon]
MVIELKKVSKGSLARALSALRWLESPKVRLEQYITDSEQAASVIWGAYMREHIAGKVIADLGCGSGVLGIGCMLLGAKKVYFVDKDIEALNLAKENASSAKSECECIFFLGDVSEFGEKVDTVVMNPPFGTKSEHADKSFLERAFSLASSVYSFHKSSTKAFIAQLAHLSRFSVNEIKDIRLPIKASMPFHRRKTKAVEVSIFWMEKEIEQDKTTLKDYLLLMFIDG